MRYKIFFIIILALITSCGLKKKKDSHAHEDVYQIFVKGDPKALIEGTDTNPESFITIENFTKFNDFYIAGAIFFAEKELYKKSNKKVDIEEGNEPSDGTETKKEPAIYSFTPSENDSIFQYKDSTNQIHLNFRKSAISNKLELVGFETEDKGMLPLSSIHYSVSPDGSKFSILASGSIDSDSNGEFLFGMFFYKKDINDFGKLQKTESRFNYIAGPGIKSAWQLNNEKQIPIDICPGVIEGFTKQYMNMYSSSTILTSDDIAKLAKSELEASLRKWDQPFTRYRGNSNNKPLLKLNYPSTCKPFTDINQHGLYWVKSYLTIPEKEYLNPGFALPLLNRSSGQLFSADVMMLESEINKLALNNSAYELNKSTKRTISHEIGHFLGLDHNFEDNNSIMSYNRVYELGYYDESAIYELYRDQLDEEDSNFPSRLTHATSMGQES